MLKEMNNSQVLKCLSADWYPNNHTLSLILMASSEIILRDRELWISPSLCGPVFDA